MTAARTARRKAIRLACRSSVGDDPVRPIAPHPWLTATAGQRLDALSARPAILQPPRCTTPAHQTRFRALALLGRLPFARVGGGVMQASEKPAQLQTKASP
jgi:hypothetical protein